MMDAAEHHGPSSAWWERRSVMAVMIALAAVPLLWPQFPPLIDLPGHMARWHIAMTIDHSPALATYYSYTAGLVGNLGMDLLVPPLAHVIGLEPATKIAVIFVAVLTAVGMLWSAVEAHRRLPPSAFAALPFVYAWPFQFGFINFALAQALVLCATALWLRLGRERRLTLRAIIFPLISFGIWVAHSAGWALFGLIAFGAEVARRRDAGQAWVETVVRAVLQCLPLALPALVMLLSYHAGSGSAAGDWFNMPSKVVWLLTLLRDRWELFDLVSLGVVFLFFYMVARGWAGGFNRLLAYPALLCGAAYLLLPRLMLGGAYVDMRMLPPAVALALLAIKAPAKRRVGSNIAMFAIGLFAVRMAAATLSFAQRASEQQQLIGVADRIPVGAAVLALVAKPCVAPWSDQRPDHLPAFAIMRRDAFINEQWDLPGQQLLRIRYDVAAPFTADPSQLVYPPDCPLTGHSLERALRKFPRGAFTHIWAIDVPASALAKVGLRPIAADHRSVLYEIVGRSAPLVLPRSRN